MFLQHFLFFLEVHLFAAILKWKLCFFNGVMCCNVIIFFLLILTSLSFVIVIVVNVYQVYGLRW